MHGRLTINVDEDAILRCESKLTKRYGKAIDERIPRLCWQGNVKLEHIAKAPTEVFRCVVIIAFFVLSVLKADDDHLVPVAACTAWPDLEVDIKDASTDKAPTDEGAGTAPTHMRLLSYPNTDRTARVVLSMSDAMVELPPGEISGPCAASLRGLSLKQCFEEHDFANELATDEAGYTPTCLTSAAP